MYHWVHIIEPGTQIIRALGSENTKTTNSPGENQNDDIKKTFLTLTFDLYFRKKQVIKMRQI